MGEVSSRKRRRKPRKPKPNSAAPPSAEQLVLSVEQAGLLLGLSGLALRRMMARGRFPFRRLGRRVFILRAELEEWLTNLPGRRLEDTWQRP